jgi:hypothetical protein
LKIIQAILQNISLRISQKSISCDMESCNQGLGIGFRFSNYEEVVKVNPEDTVSFIPHWKRNAWCENGATIYRIPFKADKALLLSM